MTTKDVLALALEALEKLAEHGAYSLSIAEPAITAIKQAQEPEYPGACKTCGNTYLATKTDVYKDKRPFIYCDCCGAMADSKTWYLTHGPAPKQAEPIWQPIESAPKDGRDIIVYFKTVGIRQVSWCDEYGDSSGEYAIWRVDDNKHGPCPLRGYSHGDDTHWMPLPTPPEAK